MKKFKILVDNRSIVYEEHTYIVEANDEDEAFRKAMEGDYLFLDYQAVDSDDYETFWDDAEITEYKGENNEAIQN